MNKTLSPNQVEGLPEALTDIDNLKNVEIVATTNEEIDQIFNN